MGIDPGLNGGVMVYDGHRQPEGFRIPNIPATFGKGRDLDYDALGILFHRFASSGVSVGFFERNSARPGQGVSSMFKFGLATGTIRGLVLAYQIPCILVTPQKWKKDCKLTGTGKAGSIKLCQDIFGTTYGNHDGMCEAALIAHYGWRITKENMERDNG
jgi:crossover junction endodeoxyribonuclease RuvC